MRSITYVLCRKKSSAWGPIRSQFGEHVGPHQHAQHNLQWWRTCTEGRRWLPSRSNGDWRRSAHESNQLRGRHCPTVDDRRRPRPNHRSGVATVALRAATQRSVRRRCRGLPAIGQNVLSNNIRNDGDVIWKPRWQAVSSRPLCCLPQVGNTHSVRVLLITRINNICSCCCYCIIILLIYTM